MSHLSLSSTHKISKTTFLSFSHTSLSLLSHVSRRIVPNLVSPSLSPHLSRRIVPNAIPNPTIYLFSQHLSPVCFPTYTVPVPNIVPIPVPFSISSNSLTQHPFSNHCPKHVVPTNCPKHCPQYRPLSILSNVLHTYFPEHLVPNLLSPYTVPKFCPQDHSFFYPKAISQYTVTLLPLLLSHKLSPSLPRHLATFVYSTEDPCGLPAPLWSFSFSPILSISPRFLASLPTTVISLEQTFLLPPFHAI